MQQAIVTLLSDFGLKDPYVAQMKAVILSKCPEAKIVDTSHEIDKFNIRMGAFILASATPYFPKGTVHVVVVDLGVGTKRRPIIVGTKHSHFVGPDNGLLMLAALKEGLRHVYAIENRKYMLSKVTKTFHGRDIFAIVTPYIVSGVKVSEFGQKIKDYVVFGEILHVDGFGNVITNISSEIIKKLGIRENEFVKIEMGGKAAALKLCSAYGDVSLSSALAIVGGHDFLEVSVDQGSAAKRFKVKSGGSISVRRQGYC